MRSSGHLIEYTRGDVTVSVTLLWLVQISLPSLARVSESEYELDLKSRANMGLRVQISPRALSNKVNRYYFDLDNLDFLELSTKNESRKINLECFYKFI